MGDTFRDPVDHLRTTRPLAGQSLIDVLHWPGYLFVVAGLIFGGGSLAGFASGHDSQGLASGLAAGALTIVGLIWLAIEHRRIRRIADRWYAEHPEVVRQRLAG